MATKPHYTAEQIRQIQELLKTQTSAGAVGAAGAGGGGLGGMLKGVTTKGVGQFGGGMLAWWLADKILSSVNQAQMQGVQREAIQSEAGMATPESLYYQASLPRAQAEEEMARSALFSQLSGGVLGPQVARGERIIGG